ncbi:hypothetical protein Tco_0182061, partial [Tanacetum coccineum]
SVREGHKKPRDEILMPQWWILDVPQPLCLKSVREGHKKPRENNRVNFKLFWSERGRSIRGGLIRRVVDMIKNLISFAQVLKKNTQEA